MSLKYIIDDIRAGIAEADHMQQGAEEGQRAYYAFECPVPLLISLLLRAPWLLWRCRFKWDQGKLMAYTLGRA